jgi:hypothetical protein
MTTANAAVSAQTQGNPYEKRLSGERERAGKRPNCDSQTPFQDRASGSKMKA